MLSSTLNVLLKYLDSLLMYFDDTVFYDRDSFDEMVKMTYAQLLNYACFVKFLGSLLMDFQETSITSILLMRQSK